MNAMRNPPGSFSEPPTVRPAAYVQPLDHWLRPRPESAGMTPVSSKLGDIAANWSLLRGMCGAFAGVGACLVGIALALLLAGATTVGLSISLLVAGGALAATGLLVNKRKAHKIAQLKDYSQGRAMGTLRSGVGLTVVIFAVLGSALGLALFPWVSLGPAGLAAYVLALLMVLLLLASCFAVPGYFIEHGRRDLRRRIAADPVLRRELEALSLSWRDPVADKNFGPL